MVQQPFSVIPSFLTAEELIKIAYNRSLKASPPLPFRLSKIEKWKRIYIARVLSLSKLLSDRLSSFYQYFPSPDDLHPFYRTILTLYVSLNDYERARRRMRISSRIIKDLASKYVKKLRYASDMRELQSIRRSAYGRIISVVRRVEKQLLLLENVRLNMRNIPSVDPDGITIVVAGYPNVGKSTFVRMISSAKPKIAEYPFTTTKLILGHLAIDKSRVQVFDTPGLLDRPLYKRSKIERLAIAAFEHVANAILFLVDPSETGGYTLAEQLSLIQEIKSMFTNIPMLIVLNKVDLASKERIACCEEFFKTKLLKMIAKDNWNVWEVMSCAYKLAISHKK